MIIAINDIGSNTLKTSVFSVDNTRYEKIAEKSVDSAIASHKENGVLDNDGIKKISDALKDFRALAESHNCDRFVCIATASLRNILNTEYVLESIKSACGEEIEIISCEEEAELALYGLKGECRHRFGHDSEDAVLVDMGGGSTELSSVKTGKTVSIPFGALSLYLLFKNSDNSCGEIDNYVYDLLSQVDLSEFYGKHVYISGGSAKSLMKAYMLINGSELTYFEELPNGLFYDIIKEIRENQEYRCRLLAELPTRAHMMLCAAAAFLKILDLLNVSAFSVTPSGIREGYIERAICEGTYEERN